MTAEQFAGQAGIKPDTLRRWGYQLNADRLRGEHKVAPAVAERLTWVEVARPRKMPASAQHIRAPMEGLELVLANGMTVRLPAGFDAEALRRLLAAVG